MSKHSKATALICGGAAMIITILFYLFAFDNIFTVPIRWVSMLFLLLAEIIGSIKAITCSKTIIGISKITSSIIHVISVLLLSLLFVNVMPFHLKQYLLINMLFLAALIVADTVISFFDSRMLSSSQAILRGCYTKFEQIRIMNNQPEYETAFKEISELLKYADNSAVSGDEIAVSTQMDELAALLHADSDTEDIKAKLAEIKATLQVRALKIAGGKRGGF
ncbi:MAG: hypothetical protein HFI90_01055 [Clostridia bacterium]|nr:hypothetical protein [Clostridia bacterium]